MASATRVALVKSGVPSESRIVSVAAGTVLASSAWMIPPAGTRPTVRWFTCTELPPLPPPKPPSDSGPCASA